MTEFISGLSTQPHPIDIEATARFILEVQKASGEIPWSIGGKTDPWDHVESAMGLTVAGFYLQARRAYRWSARTQMADGSFWADYRDGQPPKGAYKDANMSAYIATGIYHYYLVTGDLDFVREMWPVVQKAIGFVLGMQGPGGEIYWARKADGRIQKHALLTGSSSILLSINCALQIAVLLNHHRPDWLLAFGRLQEAIRNKPLRFDQTKSRFSMDWYYPILCSAVTGKAATERIARRWRVFTIPGWGVKCVSDQPWLTMAETAELTLALVAMADRDKARIVFKWLSDKHYGDGAFWTGVTYPDGVIYTDERTAWTGAAVLLATDALYCLTPGRRLFSHRFWQRAKQQAAAAVRELPN